MPTYKDLRSGGSPGRKPLNFHPAGVTETAALQPGQNKGTSLSFCIVTIGALAKGLALQTLPRKWAPTFPAERGNSEDHALHFVYEVIT